MTVCCTCASMSHSRQYVMLVPFCRYFIFKCHAQDILQSFYLKMLRSRHFFVILTVNVLLARVCIFQKLKCNARATLQSSCHFVDLKSSMLRSLHFVDFRANKCSARATLQFSGHFVMLVSYCTGNLVNCTPGILILNRVKIKLK